MLNVRPYLKVFDSWPKFSITIDANPLIHPFRSEISVKVCFLSPSTPLGLIFKYSNRILIDKEIMRRKKFQLTPGRTHTFFYRAIYKYDIARFMFFSSGFKIMTSHVPLGIICHLAQHVKCALSHGIFFSFLLHHNHRRIIWSLYLGKRTVSNKNIS